MEIEDIVNNMKLILGGEIIIEKSKNYDLSCFVYHIKKVKKLRFLAIRKKQMIFYISISEINYAYRRLHISLEREYISLKDHLVEAVESIAYNHNLKVINFIIEE